MYMSKQAKLIKEMHRNGYASWEILDELVHRLHMEFPDATAQVRMALRMDDETYAEMINKYDTCL